MMRRHPRRWLPAALLVVVWNVAGCGPSRDASAPLLK